MTFPMGVGLESFAKLNIETYLFGIWVYLGIYSRIDVELCEALPAAPPTTTGGLYLSNMRR